jgi:hypothetical protein
MLSERLFEDVLVKYPELIEDKLKFIGRQVTHFGKRIDILFEDRFKEKLIIELKIDNLQRNALSQVMEYEGFILSEKDPSARVMIIANRIHLNLKKAMDHHGIEYKEITHKNLLEFLEKRDEHLLNEITIPKQEESLSLNGRISTTSSRDTLANALDDIISRGDTWDYMVEEANKHSSRLGFKTRFTPGTISAHIKFRQKKDPNYLGKHNFSDDLKHAKTLTGVEYKYEGSLDTELTIYQNDSINKISKEIIGKIKSEIKQRSPVKMGACRDRPSKNSIGESLKKQHHSPQNLSYVIPLLIEEGFCVVTNKKPFVITKI